MRIQTAVPCLLLAALLGTVRSGSRNLGQVGSGGDNLRGWKRTQGTSTTHNPSVTKIATTTIPWYQRTSMSTAERTTIPWYLRTSMSTAERTTIPWYLRTRMSTSQTTVPEYPKARRYTYVPWYMYDRQTTQTWWNRWRAAGTTRRSLYDMWEDFRTSTPSYYDTSNRYDMSESTTNFWDRYDMSERTTNFWDRYDKSETTTDLLENWEKEKTTAGLYDSDDNEIRQNDDFNYDSYYSSSYGNSSTHWTGVYVGAPIGFIILVVVIIVLRVYIFQRRVTRAVTIVRRPVAINTLSARTLHSAPPPHGDRTRLINTHDLGVGSSLVGLTPPPK